MKLKIISAGAGSGKTYRLTQEMVALLQSGVRANGVIATTFTTKAAAELQERVRVKLLEDGLIKEANELTNALIGTVHGLGVKLLKRFAFLAGVSPQVDIIADEDQQVFFNQSLATVLRAERIREMEKYSARLGLSGNEYYDWRGDIKKLTDTARANDFSTEVLLRSKEKSITTLTAFLGQPSSQTPESFNAALSNELKETIERLNQNEDTTKKTATVVDVLKAMLRKMDLGETLNWHEWVKISKIGVGAKSKDDVVALIELARSHDTHPEFHADIRNFLSTIFDIAIEAIEEYEAYKKQRGLIDYIDMEIQVNRLLDQPTVQDILKEELDLLMVDEFQDTSPIQLEIFLKLSKIAKYSVWVGDPKQSIYGFRGAEPRLMMEIIKQNGGVKKEDIQKFSWRSREDIVHLTNAIFTKSFSDIPVEQVALSPKRTKADNPDDSNFKAESASMQDALHHWHFEYDGEGRPPGRVWVNGAIADNIRKMIVREVPVTDRETGDVRAVTAGDMAILCRSNKDCLNMAEALHRVGIKSAISRTGLLETAEAKLILACLKYMLHRSDSLSVAEILLLGDNKKIEKIIGTRLKWVQLEPEERRKSYWSKDNPLIIKLNRLRAKATELSSTEILNLLLEALDLRRIMAHWGSIPQRMDNVDMMRKFALQYEENCNRLHTAASLGGFLLYLTELGNNEKDARGSGEGTDAVNILTYHRSKGLEWPVVICHNLENSLRDNLWGMNIVAESEEVDLDNILGNRWLRYWINPYGKQIARTALSERIGASPEKQQAQQQALDEESRLLYVGVTRARDYLVFPTRFAAPKWINRCYHAGDEERPTLDAGSSESIWSWDNKSLLFQCEISRYGRDFPRVEREEGPLTYFEKRAKEKRHPNYTIDPAAFFKRGMLSIKPGKFHAYSSGPDIADPSQMRPLGKLITSYLLADDPQRTPDARREMALTLMERYEAEDLTSATQLGDWSKQFYAHLEQTYGVGQNYRNYSIQLERDQQIFTTEIDWLLIRGTSAVVVHNSLFKGEKNRYTKQAKETAGWFALTNSGIQDIFNVTEITCLVHFALGGGFVEIQVKEKAVPSKIEKNTQQKLF